LPGFGDGVAERRCAELVRRSDAALFPANNLVRLQVQLPGLLRTTFLNTARAQASSWLMVCARGTFLRFYGPCLCVSSTPAVFQFFENQFRHYFGCGQRLQIATPLETYGCLAKNSSGRLGYCPPVRSQARARRSSRFGSGSDIAAPGNHRQASNTGLAAADSPHSYRAALFLTLGSYQRH